MILITGAGTLGTEIARKLAEDSGGVFDYNEVRVVDYSEDAIWHLEEALSGPYDWYFETILADIRDRERMRLAMKGVDVVYHTAALKHVKYTNQNPIECIKTNKI